MKAICRVPVDAGVAVYRRDGSASWYLDLIQGGLRSRRSLHTRSRSKALTIARELADSLLTGRWNVQMASCLTLDRAIARFRDEYEVLHHSPATQKYTRRLFERFSEFVRELRAGREALLDSIRRPDIEAYQRHRASAIGPGGAPLSPATVNRDVREIGTLMRWAQRQGAVRASPCEGVKPLKQVRRLRTPLSGDEVARLLPALPPLLREVATLVLNTGLRLGEALHLRGGDIDVKQRKLAIRSRPDYLIKDREERELPLNDPALAVVGRRLLAAGERLVFASPAGGVLDRRNTLRALHSACDRVGMRRVSWYLMRHTFATEMAKSVTPHVLKTLLGHSDVRTADKFYVHLRGTECLPWNRIAPA